MNCDNQRRYLYRYVGGRKSPNNGGLKVKTAKATANTTIVKIANDSEDTEQIFAELCR